MVVHLLISGTRVGSVSCLWEISRWLGQIWRPGTYLRLSWGDISTGRSLMLEGS